MNLSTLSPRPGAKHRIKRLGCGESSGHGKTSGKGHKGQKARAGGTVRHGFEGGQMPIYRRLPKKGFSNVDFAIRYATINVSTLNERFDDGAEVNEAALRAAGLVKGRQQGIKVLGDGELTKKLTVSVDKVSASAREKIEKAGGKVVDAAPPAK
ncbi:MAG TPA: 50S ribosomal protein L15 [Verrucomicrobiales bacterium]|jgi:large subunit ribosomal protein L15|nr:50S ribosomal protein L15 [Verrucomicrobiales bacterium]